MSSVFSAATLPERGSAPGRWFGAVVSLELRRLLSYRADFWMHFLGGTLAQMALAYFLWRAVFRARAVESLNGFHLDSLLLYYLLVAFTERLVRGTEGSYVSRDIYDGSLNRYLLYPIPFFGYRFALFAGGLVFSLAQACVGVSLFLLFVGPPVELQLSVRSVAASLAVIFAAGGMHFCLTLGLELLAFWVDHVWSLLALLRFVVYLLGGGMIPLEFFPEAVRAILFWTPFPHIFSTPIGIWSGRLPPADALGALGVVCIWGLAFWAVALLLWRKGRRVYTGVGI